MSLMQPLSFILATAGHVDHGKSSVVKALTGIDPDRLPEEKARGITIDLGFAHLELPAPAGAANQPPFHLGIVDVPGHEDFVKNMVAGVGSIDLALFIVAADDGWMPQTEEHLQILNYLGVTRAVVALTKIDLATDEAAVIAALREKLRGSPFAEALVVATSTVTGRGFDELKTTLARVLAQTPPPRDFGKPRLPVDRVFTLRGFGTVITGTLTGGTLKRGQAIVIQPAGQATRARTLQNHNHDVESAGPGTRTAVNLPDVALRSETQLDGVGRGDVLTVAELGAAGNTIDVVLEKSPRASGGAARLLKDGALVRVHHGSANHRARVCLLDRKPLAPGERVIAQLRFEAPVFVFTGDRFIIRDWAEQETLAGGVVLDADASRRTFRREKQRKFLTRLAAAPADVRECVAAWIERDGVANRAELLLKSLFSAAAITAAVNELTAAGLVVVAGELVADAAQWRGLRQRAEAAIDAIHQTHPELPGLPLNQLRAELEPVLPMPEVFDALVADLTRGGFRQSAAAIQRATHRPALPPNLAAAGARLRAALAAKPFEPPSRKELAPDAVAQLALRFLLQTGEAVELGAEAVLSADAFARATEIVKGFLRAQGRATVSELRQPLGTSRRILVPLLEKLDRDGITQRQGDWRVLGKKA